MNCATFNHTKSISTVNSNSKLVTQGCSISCAQLELSPFLMCISWKYCHTRCVMKLLLCCFLTSILLPCCYRFQLHAGPANPATDQYSTSPAHTLDFIQKPTQLVSLFTTSSHQSFIPLVAGRNEIYLKRYGFWYTGEILILFAQCICSCNSLLNWC